MSRTGRLIITVLGLVTLCLFTGLVHPLLPVIALVLGWIPSSVRLFQAYHSGTGSTLLFGLAVAALLGGSHAFARWLVGSQTTQPPGTANRHYWRWKWTWVGYGILLCALLGITSIVLTVHQLYWLSRSKQPWFVNRWGPEVTLIASAGPLEQAAELNRWDSARTQAAFWEMPTPRDSLVPLGESLRPIWVEESPGRLRAVVLLPRQTSGARSYRFAVLRPGTNCAWADSSTLPQVLASLGGTNMVTDRHPRGLLLP